MLQQSDAQESEVCTFIREIWQYATIQELDETVLNRLISRILVGKVKNADGQKTQEVRIVYNFVGGGDNYLTCTKGLLKTFSQRILPFTITSTYINEQ